jgi:hypothetical protein
MEGDNISESTYCSLKEFQKWAKFEVIAENNTWIRKIL